ncbi:MAG TPA: hypothetical protein VLL76_03545, partial [Candidatus Omnitrophota bacterium]|nr:hypothetical protein [Candidatus Omnitrophota bacterium]
DSRAPLPMPLLSDASDVTNAVASRVDQARQAVDERLTRMDATDQQRVRQTAGAFLHEMEMVLYSLRGVLDTLRAPNPRS